MALQFCPNWQEQGFTWSIDEEESDYTQWNCWLCNYKAEEDENAEKICDKCQTKTLMCMKSDDDFFWFCTNCRDKTNAKAWQ